MEKYDNPLKDEEDEFEEAKQEWLASKEKE